MGKHNRIKILFLLQNLGGGGAERALVNLVNNMDQSRFDITVITMFGDGVNAKALNPRIRYRCRRARNFKGVSQVLKHVDAKTLYRLFVGYERFDIAVAYMHGLPTYVIGGCANPSTKLVAWLHTGDMENTSLFRSFTSFDKALETLKRFEAIVPVARSAAASFTAKTGISDNIWVRYNSNDLDAIRALSLDAIDSAFHEALKSATRPIVCSLGKLEAVKGYDRLIEVCSRLKENGLDHSLLLIGDGSERDFLRRRAEKLGVELLLVGFQNNPYKFLLQADMFVCSSVTEGLSTATIEALSIGLPCVSVRVSGAEEILGSHSEYGLVVDNDANALFDGLKKMLSSETLCEQYKERSLAAASEFGVQKTVGAVEDLFAELANEGGELGGNAYGQRV